MILFHFLNFTTTYTCYQGNREESPNVDDSQVAKDSEALHIAGKLYVIF
jgi:hypothetical protein